MGIGTVFKGIRFSQIALTTAILRQFDREAAGRYLNETLATIPGVPGKIQQFISFRAERSSAKPPAMPLEIVRAEIERSSPKLAQDLIEIEENPQTASLGQVHRGRLSSDTEVAIKVMYPGVRQEVQSQLDLLIAAARLSPAARYAFDAAAYQSFLRQHFACETDYGREAELQLRFAQIAGQAIVPKVYAQYSSEDILVQSFEASLSLEQVLTLSQAERARCAGALARLFSNALLNGLVHGDLQPGNWGYRVDSAQLVLYDYGAVVELDEQKLAHLFELIELCRIGRAGDTSDVYLTTLVGLGFDRKKLEMIQDELPQVCRAVFRGMTELGHRAGQSGADFNGKSDDALELEIDRSLGARKWWLRTAGPPWFFLFLRAVGFFFSTLRRLDANDHSTLLALYLETLRRWQEKSGRPALFAATASPGVSEQLPMLSKYLNVRVTDGSEEIVLVQLPARAVDDLEYLVPPEVASAAEARGYSFAEIKLDAQASGYPPRDLVDFSIGKKRYHVWLD